MTILEIEQRFRELLVRNSESLMKVTSFVEFYDRVLKCHLFSKKEKVEIREERLDCRRQVVNLLHLIFENRCDIASCVNLRRVSEKWGLGL